MKIVVESLSISKHKVTKVQNAPETFDCFWNEI